jgi:putative (di)nucleoside polyphosphate hydrolase
MRFVGSDGDIDLATKHPEFDAWQWVAAARLPEFAAPFKHRLYLDLLTEFQDRCVPA